MVHFALEAGSHWALMFFINKNCTFQILDSMGGCCEGIFENAKNLKTKIELILGIKEEKSKDVSIIENIPSQINSFDCGMYVICFCESLIISILKSSDFSLNKETLSFLKRVTPKFVQSKRKETYTTLIKLIKE